MSSSETAIKVRSLSKQYLLGTEPEQAHSLKGRLQQTLSTPFRWLTSQFRAPSEQETLWALRDVSFDVQRGEVVGIIGHNGAGKSTLLKILSRITEPSSGYAEIHGRIAALLEVGTGMHPELTGRENIFMNGTVLGMKKREIQSKFDEIVEFSGVGRFLDTPVKRYSSGMRVRLGFAIAAHLEPEILIIDEVLAVGDAAFQQKCLGKMQDVSSHGRTVLFVSHNMAAVENLCSRAIVMDKGTISYVGDTSKAIVKYHAVHGGDLTKEWKRPDGYSAPRDGSEAGTVEPPVKLKRIAIALHHCEDGIRLHADLDCEVVSAAYEAIASITIVSERGTVIGQALPQLQPFINQRNPHCRIAVDLPDLIPGRYILNFWCGASISSTYDKAVNAVNFDISSSPMPGRTHPHSHLFGYVVPRSSVISRGV